MTAHIVYEAFDRTAPATFSKRIIEEIVRQEIGFQGLLLSDDINMGALEGDLPSRALKALDSGCDIVLHCSGELGEMADIAKALPPMSPDAVSRFNKVLGAIDD
jgi:beta-N-acetylhexosaminidase